MSDLQERFEQAQREVITLSKHPGNDELVALYALGPALEPRRLDIHVGRVSFRIRPTFLWNRLEHADQSEKKNPSFIWGLFHSGTARDIILAERAGFEPAIRFDPYTRFPGVLLKPLGHLSVLIV